MANRNRSISDKNPYRAVFGEESLFNSVSNILCTSIALLPGDAFTFVNIPQNSHEKVWLSNKNVLDNGDAIRHACRKSKGKLTRLASLFSNARAALRKKMTTKQTIYAKQKRLY